MCMRHRTSSEERLEPGTSRTPATSGAGRAGEGQRGGGREAGGQAVRDLSGQPAGAGAGVCCGLGNSRSRPN